MASESGFNPVPAIVHLLAIAAGLLLGLWAMDAIAPDLPPADAEAGLIAPAETGQVRADDVNSLFRAGPLAEALDALDEQLGSSGALIRVHVEPGRLTTETSSSARGFELEALDLAAPERIIELIAAERPEVRGLEDAVFFDFRVNAGERPGWYVQLASAIAPPRTYVAPPDGSRVRAGGTP